MPKIVSCSPNPISIKVGSKVIFLLPWSGQYISNEDLELGYKSISKMVSLGVLRIVKEEDFTVSLSEDVKPEPSVLVELTEKVDEKVDEEEEVIEIPDISYLSNMSKKDLLDICNRLGLDADPSLKKVKLIRLISQFVSSQLEDQK